MAKSVKVEGTIEKVVFSSGDYHILSLRKSDGERVSCKGSFFPAYCLISGLKIEVQGKPSSNAKYGPQVDVQLWRPLETNSVSDFLRYFVGGIPEVDIGLLEIATKPKGGVKLLLGDPRELAETCTSSSYESLINFVDALVTAHEIISILGSSAITSSQIRVLFDKFGAELKDILKTNPYRLLEAGGNIQFSLVDQVAFSMGFGPDSPIRAEGAVLWALRDALTSGHLCLRRGDLATEVDRMMCGQDEVQTFSGNLSETLIAATERMAARGAVCIDPEVGVYLPKYFNFERGTAKLLTSFLGPSTIELNIQEFIQKYEESQGIELSFAQKEGILKLLESRVLVITGQPGTGKTSLTRALVALFEQAGLQFTLMAPTGIAAKRLSAATGHAAGTIHRTLGYQGDSWAYGEDSKFSTDVVILDEASMVDQEVFYQVLQSLSQGTVLVIVGDDAQLPSVGPGNVLRELISSGVAPVVRLDQIFRQAAASKIICNAHSINKGVDIDTGDSESDFRFVSMPTDKIPDFIVKMAEKLKSRDANFQVISPKYDGVVGVNALNNVLRCALNPASDTKHELKVGSTVFRDGDRVIITKNDYKMGVYNGDTGKLVEIERDQVIVRVYSGGYGVDRLVSFKRSEFGEKVRLAYAITTHRSQGSEYGTVILPFVAEQGRMLQRNLLYTAVTRAKEKVWVLGDMSAIRKAIANDKVVYRGTGLAKALRSEVENAAGK